MTNLYLFSTQGLSNVRNRGKSVPETWWCVVEGVHFSLHLVVQNNWTLLQSVAYQVLSSNDHSYPGTTHILLSPGENQPELHNAGRHVKILLIVWSVYNPAIKM